jgi:hypothetical protein
LLSSPRPVGKGGKAMTEQPFPMRDPLMRAAAAFGGARDALCGPDCAVGAHKSEIPSG